MYSINRGFWFMCTKSMSVGPYDNISAAQRRSSLALAVKMNFFDVAHIKRGCKI